MRVLPDSTVGGNSCRLVASGLGIEVGIQGLSPEEMEYRLQGRGRRWEWSELVKRGPITVGLVSEPVHGAVEGETTVYEKDLPDGRIRLISGGEAEFQVGEGHKDTGGILPYSFHAALAQQLARAGVLTMHAAAIATPYGGVLAIGRKGAGKSTLAASAIRCGLGVVSDDWILASLDQTAPRAQRMRGFMVLRKGWATEQLREHLPGELLRDSGARPKLNLSMPMNDVRFPEWGEMAAICVLERPKSGRRDATQISRMPPHMALAALTESSMPIVLSKRLPVERASLLPGLTGAVAASCYRVRAGLDLIESAPQTWARLLESVGLH
jgi:hypothetical protein